MVEQTHIESADCCNGWLGTGAYLFNTENEALSHGKQCNFKNPRVLKATVYHGLYGKLDVNTPGGQGVFSEIIKASIGKIPLSTSLSPVAYFSIIADLVFAYGVIESGSIEILCGINTNISPQRYEYCVKKGVTIDMKVIPY